MRTAQLALLALTAAFAAGCGGSDEENPTTSTAAATTTTAAERAVRTAAQRLITTHDATVVCTQLVTTAFVQEVFDGKPKACVASTIADPATDGTRQTVGAVAVSGDQATVELRATSDEIDAGGHATFARDGSAWKLDRYQDDYVRSILAESVKAARAGGGDGALADPALGRCFQAQAERLDDASARRFLFSTLSRDRTKGVKLGNRMIEACPDELAGYVATRLANGLFGDRGASKAFVRCAKRQLRGLLSLTDLSRVALTGNTSDAGTAALAGLAQGVKETCSGKT